MVRSKAQRMAVISSGLEGWATKTISSPMTFQTSTAGVEPSSSRNSKPTCPASINGKLVKNVRNVSSQSALSLPVKRALNCVDPTMSTERNSRGADWPVAVFPAISLIPPLPYLILETGYCRCQETGPAIAARFIDPRIVCIDIACRYGQPVARIGNTGFPIPFIVISPVFTAAAQIDRIGRVRNADTGPCAKIKIIDRIILIGGKSHHHLDLCRTYSFSHNSLKFQIIYVIAAGISIIIKARRIFQPACFARIAAIKVKLYIRPGIFLDSRGPRTCKKAGLMVKIDPALQGRITIREADPAETVIADNADIKRQVKRRRRGKVRAGALRAGSI